MPEPADLLAPLVDRPPVPPDVERIKTRSRRRRRRRTSLLAIAAVLVIIAGVGLVRALSDPSSTKVTTAGVPEPSTTTTATTVPGASEAANPFAEVTPWSAPALTAAAVPEQVRAWNSDPAAQAACPLLVPDDLGAGAGATPRSSTRGQPGAWWIAYDLPGAPGEAEIQTPSIDAGIETFFVSATAPSSQPYGDPTAGWDHQHYWDDGSSVGYGIEGRGLLPSGPGLATAWLAYMHVAGTDCLYELHTYLGEAHLVELINHLRFVTGAP